MYQSVDKQEPELEGERELYYREPVPPVPERNKGPSRCYNVVMIVVYFALLLMAVVALGSFGAKQSQITDRAQKEYNSTARSCILYSTYVRTEERDNKKIVYIRFHTNGVCGYVFWGLTSITIVAFVWFIYSIVQAVIAPSIISVSRILDLIVMGMTCILSFTLSVTIHAGIEQTCQILVKHSDAQTCQGAYLAEIPEKNIKKLDYYDVMNTAKSSSWATTVSLIVLSIWYIVMAISYCCVLSNRQKQYVLLQDQENQNNTPTAV